MTHPGIGANYTPRIGWFHSWADLDAALVDEDMAQIAQLGLDHVRIFPLWPLLQPNRTLISSRAIQDVLTVVDIAGRHGLAVSVDLLQGHLSSYDFLPAWVSTWHRRNLFTDPLVLAAQQQLARVLGTELADRPHVSGMTLGNEIGQFAVSYHPDRHETSDEQATAWTRDLLAVVDEVLPGRRNHHSFDDCLWFKDDHPFTPADAVLLGASTTVHSWVFTGAGQALGEGHPGLALFGRYLTEVASAWNRALGQADRKVWLQEIGAPVPWVAPQDAAEFADASVRAALGNPDVEAVTWWCSHDVHRDLADFPEVEYSLGLFDAEGGLKPIGEAYGAIARELRDGAGTSASPAASAAAPVVLEGMDPAGSDRSRLSPKGDIFRSWAEAALDGEVSPLEIRL